MAINKLEAGEYIGYINGEGKPTLYFENGHFTQSHDYKNNVGWHSNGTRHYYGNIGIKSQATLKQIHTLADNKTLGLELKNFISKFELGLLESNAFEAVLCECYLNGKQFRTEVSKSKLIKNNDTDYDKKINKAYVDKVLYNGNWAVKEYHTK